MQFAGQVPPTGIVVLFVTFFPLQGFFNLVVYMFPRFVRYFEIGVPLTESFRRSSFSVTRRFSLAKKRPSRNAVEAIDSSFTKELYAVGKASSALVSERVGADENKESRVSFVEGIIKDGDEHALELDTDDTDQDGCANEDAIEEGNNVEKDAIDELEHIVEA